MNLDCVGKSVSLDCGPLGFYQGVIASIHLAEETLTLKDAFQNGKACDVPAVTLSARDIQDLQFVEIPVAVVGKVSNGQEVKAKPKASVVQVAKKKKGGVAESLAQNSYAAAAASAISGGNNAPKQQPRSKSAGKPMHRASPARSSPKKAIAGNFDHHGHHQHRNTPNRRERDRLRDEDCFDDSNEVGEDFDFEKNLALFDKKMVLDEITDDISSNQPDIVRLVDCNRRKPEPKYRNDENVLVSIPAQFRKIETGEMPPPGEYVTDDGLVVPAVSYELRSRFEKKMEDSGIGLERVTELMARAGVELSIQLFGGQHRLNPNNSHQIPRAVVFVGPSRSGAFGFATARHLVTQGVETVVYVPDLPVFPDDVDKEFKLYKMSGGKWTKAAKNLPTVAIDLLITAMEDHEMWTQERRQPWLRGAQEWAQENCPRVNVLALDPPNSPDEPVMPTKISLVPGLPLWFPGGQNSGTNTGKMYTVNLAVPEKIYKAVGIKYSPPYGAKTVIPLYKIP